jgi:hypothetical protein
MSGAGVFASSPGPVLSAAKNWWRGIQLHAVVPWFKSRIDELDAWDYAALVPTHYVAVLCEGVAGRSLKAVAECKLVMTDGDNAERSPTLSNLEGRRFLEVSQRMSELLGVGSSETLSLGVVEISETGLQALFCPEHDAFLVMGVNSDSGKFCRGRPEFARLCRENAEKVRRERMQITADYLRAIANV